MSSTVVLYKSKHGSTKQYAEWLAADLKADLYEPANFMAGDWEKYSTVVYCGGLYANSINGVKFIAKNHARLGGKKVVIVACGLSYPHIKSSVARVANGLGRKLPQTLHTNVKLFMVRGAVNYSRLGFLERLILTMLEKMLRSKKSETLGPEEKEMLSVLGKDFSFVDRESIQAIVNHCRTAQGLS